MPKRKADMFAGQGSFAAGLRRRREAIESGNLQKASQEFRKGLKPSKKPKHGPLR